MKVLALICIMLGSVNISAQLSLWSDFEDGTLEGWTNTDTSVTMLTVQNEAGFWFLHKECDGSNSAVGEMAIINASDEWAGNHWYEPSTGETALIGLHDIQMRNTNDFPIHIRIGITGSNGFQVVTTEPLVVPALSNWDLYEAPYYGVDWLSLYNLTVLNDTTGMTGMEINAHVIEMFEDVIEYRIIHNNQISYDGEIVNGFLEIDDLFSYWLLSSEETQRKNFVLYPNPASEKIYLSSEGRIINSVTFYTASGQKIALPGFNTASFYDISSLSNGIYFVQIESEKGAETLKFLKN